jgi:hypothetical protein
MVDKPLLDYYQMVRVQYHKKKLLTFLPNSFYKNENQNGGYYKYQEVDGNQMIKGHECFGLLM